MAEQPQPAGIDLLRAEQANALSCIRCGQCLSVCPTYQLTFAEEQSPRGRIALALAVLDGALPLTDDFVASAESCLLCEACTAICPAGVRMEPIGVAVRAVLAGRRGLHHRLRAPVLRLTLGSMPRFRVLCRLAWLYQRSGVQWLARRSGALRLLHLSHADRLLPAMPRAFLRPHGQQWSPPAGTADQGTTALFTGCVMSTAFAATTVATARTLARRGRTVVAPAGQGCCGALPLHAGAVEEARRLARINVDAFAAAGVGSITVNSAGCGSTLKGYGHLLAGDPDYRQRAATFAAGVRDITEELAGLPEAPAAVQAVTVTFQEPCHLAHAQRIVRQPRTLLRRIPGVDLREMRGSAVCCGSAGTYNLSHPATAGSLLTNKLANAADTGATIIATANPGCLLHLQAGLVDSGSTLTVRHIVDILDAAERPCDPPGWEG